LQHIKVKTFTIPTRTDDFQQICFLVRKCSNVTCSLEHRFDHKWWWLSLPPLALRIWPLSSNWNELEFRKWRSHFSPLRVMRDALIVCAYQNPLSLLYFPKGGNFVTCFGTWGTEGNPLFCSAGTWCSLENHIPQVLAHIPLLENSSQINSQTVQGYALFLTTRLSSHK
jgi:hypothetical protein